jgi:hypothetical protein
MENIEKLKEFIIKNELQFTEGRRNSDCVVLAGFALFLGIKKGPMEILDIVGEIDSFPDSVFTAELNEEFERVLDFAVANDYGAWWASEDAKKLYIF